MGLCWLYELLSDPDREGGERVALWILGDESGLVEKTGGNGAFLLLDVTESMGRKVVELRGRGLDLELPLLLPLVSLVVMEVPDSPVD